MCKAYSLTLMVIFLGFNVVSAQEINPEIFKKNIEILYEGAAKAFKEIKSDESGTTADGEKKFIATRKISGAKEVYIKADAENSYTYVATFESKDLATAQAKIEEMVAMILEQVADKGFVRSKGTETRYEGYRKTTIEFDSDNIDIMGKYPSFSIGVIRGSSPVTIELIINEPFWK